MATQANDLIASLLSRKNGTSERMPRPPRAHFERGLQGSNHNPADTIALLRVAMVVAHAKEPVSLPAAAEMFMRVRCGFLEVVQAKHYPQLKLCKHSSPTDLQRVRQMITERLPVMAFPYYFRNAAGKADTWSYALFADVPTVEVDEAARVVATFYRVLAVQYAAREGFSPR